MWVLFIDVFFIVLNVVLRRFFNMPIFGATEIIRYLMFVAASFSFVENEWVDGNINMLLFVDKLKTKPRAFLLFIVNIISTVGVGIVTYLFFKQFQLRLADQTSTIELNIPLWLPAIIVMIGFALLTAALAGKSILWFWMWKTGGFINFREIGSLREKL
jgi:TRAP-type C4-dicarboxylate transport system permease small subunit